jgi:hypothetical protein
MTTHSGHASHDDRSKLLLALGAGAGSDDHWRDTEDEGQASHGNGPEAHTTCRNRRLLDWQTLLAQRLGEFND